MHLVFLLLLHFHFCQYKIRNCHYIEIDDRKEAIKYAIENARKGDFIILLGKGHETYQILKSGTIHLDEREVVADHLTEMRK